MGGGVELVSNISRKKKVDSNQNDIINGLINAGFSVETDHDDLIIGRDWVTVWIELKSKYIFRKDGKILKDVITDDQYRILFNFRGQYNICWRLDLIQNCHYAAHSKTTVLDFENPCTVGLSAKYFQQNWEKLLTLDEINRLRIIGIIK